jgi:hypothetical protein
MARLLGLNHSMFWLRVLNRSEALCFTPLSTWFGWSWVGYDWETWHSFVVPHPALSGLLLAFYGCGMAGVATDRQLRTVAGRIQPLAAGTCFWAMIQWAGGDDGGGMSWLLIMGPLTERLSSWRQLVSPGERALRQGLPPVWVR